LKQIVHFPLSIHYLGKYQNYITSHPNKELQDTLQILVQIQIQILLRFWAWGIPLVYECTT